MFVKCLIYTAAEWRPGPQRAKHFHKKTLRTLFKKSLNGFAFLIILKDITKIIKKSQKVWAVYKQYILIQIIPIVKDITKAYLFFPDYPNIIYIFKTFVYGFWIFLGIFYMF